MEAQGYNEVPCYHPLKGYRSKEGKVNGKWAVTFNPKQGYTDLQVTVPCGQCVGCRLERSRQWAMRCVHEMRLHEHNSFITLTFDDQHLNPKETLVKSDFQNFMKRLRKNTGAKIRYFHCGEYGENLSRPHHHAILFGYDFEDKKLFKTQKGNKLYSSDILDKAWQHKGWALIGEANFETAAYTARYILKKVTGPAAGEHYNGKIPEYCTMSRRPGIGRDHYEKYKDEIFPDDYCVIRNQKMNPPKYYLDILGQDSLQAYEYIKAQRHIKAKNNVDYDNYSRLPVKEEVTMAKVNLKQRPIE